MAIWISIKYNAYQHFHPRLALLRLSWRRSFPFRSQFIDLQNKLMDWFLYDRDLRHERLHFYFYFSSTPFLYPLKTLGNKRFCEVSRHIEIEHWLEISESLINETYVFYPLLERLHSHYQFQATLFFRKLWVILAFSFHLKLSPTSLCKGRYSFRENIDKACHLLFVGVIHFLDCKIFLKNEIFVSLYQLQVQF